MNRTENTKPTRWQQQQHRQRSSSALRNIYVHLLDCIHSLLKKKILEKINIYFVFALCTMVIPIYLRILIEDPYYDFYHLKFMNRECKLSNQLYVWILQVFFVFVLTWSFSVHAHLPSHSGSSSTKLKVS